MAVAAPVTDRIDWLDALRGFVLLGILLANILYWSGWLFMPEPQKVTLAGAVQTQWDLFLHKLLVDGKFYTLFSTLFGLGFSLQLERLRRRGADGLRIFRRRILALLLIGLIHMFLIWDGDILTLYALLGLLLPWFRDWPDRRLLGTAVALLLLPLFGVPLFRALGWHHIFSGTSSRPVSPMRSAPGRSIRMRWAGCSRAAFARTGSGW